MSPRPALLPVYRVNALSLASLVTAVVCFSLAHRVYLKDRERRLNQLAAGLFLTLTLFYFSEFQLRDASSLEEAGVWGALFGVSFPAIALFFHLCWHWGGWDRTARYSQGLLTVVHSSSLLVAIGHLRFGFLGTPTPHRTGIWILDTGAIDLAGSLAYGWAIVLCGTSVVLGWRALRRAFTRKRRLRHLVIGLLGPATLGLFADLVPLLLGSAEPPLGALFVPFCMAGIYLGVSQDSADPLTVSEAATELAAAVSEALLLTDPEGTVLAVNPTLCALSGRQDLDLVGEHASVLLGAAWDRPELNGFDAALYTADGEVEIRLTRRPIWDADGGLRGFICAAADRTEVLRAELAAERARDEASEAMQTKDEFLATMSHELRTPMNAVIGMANLLQDTGLSPRQREFVQTIASSGDALLTLINDLLDFSRLEADRVELEQIPFEPRACVEGALELLAARAAAKGLYLSAWIDEDTPGWVKGDPTRVQQILVNLVTNAVKFTDAGEVVASVQASAMEDGGYRLTFAVRDTGMGIPAERMDRLFKSFSQVDSSIRRTHGGTGLGLAISKRLVRRMGGSIGVDSEPGRGSTFQFTIPVPSAGPRQLRLLRQPGPLSGRRLLVLERESTWRRILRRQLVSWGVDVEQTGSPEDAAERLGCDRYDAVVAAWEVLGGAGLRALGGGLGDTPVLLLGPPGALGEEAGAIAGRLSRPVRQARLKEALEGLFTEAPARPLQRQAPAPAAPRLRILLAEDHLVNQRVALSMLERLSLTADVAEDGVGVLEALSEGTYDVVLMDVMMPEMDGLEATRRVRERWPTRPLQIIALTANAMAGDRERCFAAGVDDYIAKPIRAETLETALREAARRLGLRAA